MKNTTTLFLIIITFLTTGSIAFAKTIHVPADHPTIQAGIDAASDGDTVLVADGTYTGDGNRDIDFKRKAITLKSENGADNCIIDCGSAWEKHRGFYFHSNETENSVVDGFTIQNGNAMRGGGIYCYESSPMITNNIITGNSAYGRCGGGIYCEYSDSTIINNIIAGNSVSSAGGGGGGIYCQDFFATIKNNTITSNSATLGGGIYREDSFATIKNNTITGNSASHRGGGIYCETNPPMITNNTIIGNTITGNLASEGGGIYCCNLAVPTLINCILWNDAPQEIYFGGGCSSTDYPNGIIVSYSNVQGGEAGIVSNHPDDLITWGEGNIDTAPLFVEAASGNYRLLPDSPCIDAGTADEAPDTDIEWNKRPLGDGVDIGAFEQAKPTTATGDVTRIAFVEQPPEEMIAGGKFQFRLVGYDKGNQTVDIPNSNATWEVTGGIGNTSNAGLFTATTVGAGLIKAILKSNTAITTQSKEITVIAGTPADVSISISPDSLTAGSGARATVTITITDTFGNPVTGEKITLTATNGSIQETADEVGNGVYKATYVAGTKVGEASVKARTANGITKPADLTLTEVVLGDLTKISFVQQPPTQMIAGKSFQFSLVGYDATGQSADIPNSDLLWEVTNDIGNINDTGLFTATTVGTGRIKTTLKANAAIRTESTEITVIHGDAADVSLAISADNLYAGSGETTPVTITVADAFGNFVTGETIALVATDGEVSSALEKGDGVYTATYTAGTIPGEVTIRAIASNGAEGTVNLTLKEGDVVSLTVILQPSEVRFMESVDVLGVLSVIGDEPTPIDGSEIQITLTSPGDFTFSFEVKTDAQGNYSLPDGFVLSEVGQWHLAVRFEGSKNLQAAERSLDFTVKKGVAEITFDTQPIGALGQEIEVIGRLVGEIDETSVLSVKVLRPSGAAATIEGITTEAMGIFRHPLKLDMAGDWEVTATWRGNDNYESVTEKLLIHVSEELGKAIIVLGGGNKSDNPAWERFNRVAEYVHNVFKRRRFDDEEDIFFLSPDPNAEEADNVTSASALEFAITNWAAKQVNEQVPLYLYLLSHNLEDKFLLDKRGTQETYLTPAQLDLWLDQLPEGTPVTIIIEACHSGYFIRNFDGQATALVSPNRTLIVSARRDRQAMLLSDSSSFSKVFFDRISANQTVGDAFRYAEDYMRRANVWREQFPQIDANGDGKVNTEQDYARVANRYLPADIVSLFNPPEFVALTPPQKLPEGAPSLAINAELLGTGITRVFATVIPPNFDPTQRISDWSALDFDEFDLVQIDEQKYAGTYSDFSIPGDYIVIVSAENADGSATPVQTTITVPSETPWDVNWDGVVDISDLVVVGTQFGQSGQDLSGDVNKDGTVDISDLVLVGSHFGESTVVAAPSLLKKIENEKKPTLIRGGEGKTRLPLPRFRG